MLCNIGRYGAWDELKAQIRQSWRFRFDWFFKSRTPQVRKSMFSRPSDCLRREACALRSNQK